MGEEAVAVEREVRMPGKKPDGSPAEKEIRPEGPCGHLLPEAPSPAV